ncbi:hypothetical protein P153DRAFT_370074 [Dothidotthia symphoricarpi CBS 119687]|uniref:20S-pre-rRNA D-site endonuclease NOB1 n=1 Tax=Dothidotthia symphoricarpi CBS 119687 TaxID=1392245 RepID=A0A6A6A3C1_9PLEO|nr:uncharacterized protein P153DRAFT_370074 [Dothidotthia symphoricarpi CBS 119687]KAF2125407.1 hypothetical protein P153DRAFT_370074 [Dothidotthia symphoricarpi CBS 119687]
MATENSQKPIHSLILDTGPLIKNAVSISTIINSAEELYTTPAILSEIRDEATRSRVKTTLMPFLKIRNPRPASYEAVIAFSKKTGDHAVLSRQDLGILALAYEIHCERNGGPWGLRDAPKGPLKQKPEEEKKEAKLAESEQPTSGEGQVEPQSEQVVSEEKAAETTTTGEDTTEQEAPTAPTVDDQQELETQAEQSNQEQEPTSTEQKSVEPEVTTAPENLSKDIANLAISSTRQPTQQPTPPATDSSNSDNDDDDANDNDDDNDGEWITPSNLTKHKAKDSGAQTSARTASDPQTDVATMTIDFAMQNVLLQMNLHLLSTNMQRIKQLKSKVLRCHACFNIVKDTTKQFCPRCGGATLKSVSCSTNAKGEFRVHLAKNYQYNTRGDRYSVPKPIAGTANGKWSGQGGGKGGWGRDLILAEDQKEYSKQMTEEKRRGTKDLMDEDYLPGILTGDRGRAGGRPKVGAGKNANSRKRF